jgi:signal-transduction protein with cAMP-binding, CBS, and nucleotidyltransferase domain
MAVAWKPFAPDVHLSGKNPINLKKLQMPLTGLVRLYALRHAVIESTGVEKSISLYKSNIFSKEMMAETIEAWKTLMRLRLKGQQQALLAGAEPGNELDPSLIGPEARYLLEKSIRGIENLMLKAANDFHTNLG